MTSNNREKSNCSTNFNILALSEERRFSMRTFILSAVIAMLMTFSVSVYAQENGLHNKNDLSSYKELFFEGVEYYNNGKYNEALETFNKVYSYKESDWEILYNIGKCYSKLKQYGVAIDILEQYLRSAGDDINSDAKIWIKTELERIKKKVVVVAIDAPNDITVYVDGITRGVTPIPSGISVSSGFFHEFEFKKSNISLGDGHLERIFINTTINVDTTALEIAEKITSQKNKQIDNIPVKQELSGNSDVDNIDEDKDSLSEDSEKPTDNANSTDNADKQVPQLKSKKSVVRKEQKWTYSVPEQVKNAPSIKTDKDSLNIGTPTKFSEINEGDLIITLSTFGFFKLYKTGKVKAKTNDSLIFVGNGKSFSASSNDTFWVLGKGGGSGIANFAFFGIDASWGSSWMFNTPTGRPAKEMWGQVLALELKVRPFKLDDKRLGIYFLGGIRVHRSAATMLSASRSVDGMWDAQGVVGAGAELAFNPSFKMGLGANFLVSTGGIGGSGVLSGNLTPFSKARFFGFVLKAEGGYQQLGIGLGEKDDPELSGGFMTIFAGLTFEFGK